MHIQDDSIRSISSDGGPGPIAEAAATGQPHCVFFLPRHPTSWARMLEQAKIVAADPALRPVVVLANKAMSAQAPICRKNALAHIDVSDEIQQRLMSASPRLGAALDRLEAWFKRHDGLAARLPFCLPRAAHLRRRLAIEYAVFSKLCRAERPVAIVVPGDRELPPVPAMLRVGLDLDIPTIIGFSGVPYHSGLELSRAFTSAFKVALKDLPPLLNRIAAQRHPSQVRKSDYGPMLFSPGWVTLALGSKAMLSDNPWMQGGGNSRYILQHSRNLQRYFESMGVAAGKSVLIGDPALDPLYAACQNRDQIRRDLTQRLGSEVTDKLVVVTVPNDYEHDVCGWDDHIARMHRFLGRLDRAGLAVLLSLHPKAKRSNYQALADDYGFGFAEASLSEVLPAADLFVCSCSTTILFAKLAAVPSINLDYLKIHDDEFENVPGLVNVETPETFTAAIDAFLAGSGPPGIERLALHAEEMAEDAQFDGRAGERFRRFLLDLSGQCDMNQAARGQNAC